MGRPHRAQGPTLDFHGQGHVTSETATGLLASGGAYTKGSPIRDIASQYLRLILGVIGITDERWRLCRAKLVGIGEQTTDRLLANLEPEIGRAVAV